MKNVAFFSFFLLLFTLGCKPVSPDFVRVENGQFKVGNKNYYYIGTNFWYGAILGSQGEGGNRNRLTRELDLLKENGINNLRILVGADGPERPNKVSPSLQTAPGVYNDTILAGLDFLLAEMQKRDMKAILYLTNSWEWSGGYSQYLEWTGHGKAPIPSLDGWNTFTEYVAQFVKSDSCKQLVKNHVSNIIKRTNQYTNIKYVDDPTIMSWQIANEPRAFSIDGKNDFAAWIADLSAYIKSIDKNHLVSTGSEGLCGTEGDIELWEKIHTNSSIDYTTIHIWPNNWGWINREDLNASVEQAINNTYEYIENHGKIAEKLHKPIVLEEFGFPRDNMSFLAGSPTSLRDKYYGAVFEKIENASKNGGVFAGCNFWAWGGYGRSQSDHVFWQEGDDYLGDPAQEEQGLNSVFDIDSTVGLVKQYNLLLIKNQ